MDTGQDSSRLVGKIDKPVVLKAVMSGETEISLLEWNWPSVFDYSLVEERLSVEMSLQPYSSNATACFEELAPGEYCIMGTLFLPFPGYVIQGRGGGGQIRVLRCQFSAAVTKGFLERFPSPSLHQLQSLLDIRGAELRSIMRLILREIDSPRDNSAGMLEALVAALRIEIERSVASLGGDEPPGRLAAWQYRRIREELVASGGRSSVAELARVCGISRRHLHRQFFNLTGEKISTYVEKYWVEQCKKMLIETQLSIKEIALALSFKNINSFSRAFRRATGMTASSYRQLHGRK